METINFKKMKLVPPKGVVYVETVGVTVGESNIFTPATTRTDKEMGFGKIVFAADQDLIGKIIIVDPWRQTPLTINGKKYIQLYSEIGFTPVEEDDE